jgi:hypothetical protein
LPITALAEAARVSRPTVYADLRSKGIDPDRRPKENTVITISPLDIEGFTGVADTLETEYDAALLRWRAEHPDAGYEEAKNEGMRLVPDGHHLPVRRRP